MKNIFKYLFSMQFMGLLLAVFATAMAVATFIENDYGTDAAKSVVYNATWFEILLVLGMINLTGSIIERKLYKKEKFTIFLFHISFVVIILGAGITRYIGYEGIMHIREGNTSNSIISENTYLHYSISNSDSLYETKKVLMSELAEKNISKSFSVDDKDIDIDVVDFVPNAVESIGEDPNGNPMIELIVAGQDGRRSIVIQEGETVRVGRSIFSLNDTTNPAAVQIIMEGYDVYIRSPFFFTSMSMMDQKRDMMGPDTLHTFETRRLYTMNNQQIVLNDYFPQASIMPRTMQDAADNSFPDAVVFNVSVDGASRTVTAWGEKGIAPEYAALTLGGINIQLGYGAKQITLPFSLKLKDFILKRYPGSQSPSWFESEVVLIDEEKGINEQRRIFMNNVLKHRGYRFYQSSYDSDEKGTVLSVNHDAAGTFVTYFGYLLLGLGMFLSIFNRNSRFQRTSKKLNELRQERKSLKASSMLILVMIISSLSITMNAQDIPQNKVIDKDHAEAFGMLLVQGVDGRIEPVNTLGSEVLRKISRKSSLNGLTSDQVFMGMMADPQFWQTIPMIKVSHDEIKSILRISGKLAPFNAFLNERSGYVLREYVEQAYQKKPAYRNKFDNEIIKVDERVNISLMTYTSGLLRIFPNPEDTTQKWYAPNNAEKHFSGQDSMVVASIIPMYFQSLGKAMKSGDYTQSLELLNGIKAFQEKHGEELIPSRTKIRMEVFYNNAGIFDRLANVYGIVGFILLILHFIAIFVPRLNLRAVIKVASVLIILAFVAHTGGLALRWYISGHAPWSNGYESMIYIGWATVLAGLIFSRKSDISLSVTAILAFLILHVAHLSWMDPEVTTLVPVLKSYWLIIHVAIITASYGFLALAALMGFLNLILMFFKNEKNFKRTDLVIAELSGIIEMSIIVGLYMLTLGTFLGGVWANESWGRYWGWDPKETWALISVIVYAFISHMRLIPGLRGVYPFNLFAVIGFGAIIMTYFGVNYYLSGLHSYAQGDPVPVPNFVYYTVAIIGIVAILAYVNHFKYEKLKQKS